MSDTRLLEDFHLIISIATHVEVRKSLSKRRVCAPQDAFWSLAIGAKSLSFSVDQVVGVLGTLAIAVINRTRIARLTRQLTEVAIACRACS